jgi:hypothetical protein
MTSTADNVTTLIQSTTLIQTTINTPIKMDPLNQQALTILLSRGTTAAVKHMFTHETDGRQLTYSEMRERYG